MTHGRRTTHDTTHNGHCPQKLTLSTSCSAELKKNTRDQRLLCAMQKERGDISTVIFTSSSMEMICFVFFSENNDKTDKVCADIAGSLKFGILGLY